MRLVDEQRCELDLIKPKCVTLEIEKNKLTSEKKLMEQIKLLSPDYHGFSRNLPSPTSLIGTSPFASLASSYWPFPVQIDSTVLNRYVSSTSRHSISVDELLNQLCTGVAKSLVEQRSGPEPSAASSNNAMAKKRNKRPTRTRWAKNKAICEHIKTNCSAANFGKFLEFCTSKQWPVRKNFNNCLI